MVSKAAILGGGSAFALNLANHLHAAGIEHFGIGRSAVKPRPFWVVDHLYPYYRAHVVDELPAVLAILDKERPDAIVSFCAQGEGSASFGDHAPDFYRTNTWGLAALTRELAKRDWLRRFVHIGTSELYGSVDHPAKETDPLRPSSPYAISKAAFDQHLEALHRFGGFPMNILRPSNAITEGQQLYRIVPKAAVCALSGRKLPLHGGGKACKSYIHADDLSKAILAVLERAPLGRIYNVAPAGAISIRALVGHVVEACGKSWEEVVEETEDRVGQDAKYVLDATAIARDVGWTQTVGLTAGVERVVRWVKQWPELLEFPTQYEHRL